MSTPLSVPGYVLEATANPSSPYTVMEVYTNRTDTNLALPLAATQKYFQLRKP